MQNPKSLTLVGTGAVVPLTTRELKSKWVQLLADGANASAVLTGGSEVTSTVGFPIAKGAAQFMPGNYSGSFEFYELNKIKVYIALNDVLYVLYGG